MSSTRLRCRPASARSGSSPTSRRSTGWPSGSGRRVRHSSRWQPGSRSGTSSGSVLRFPTAADLRDPYLHVTPALDALASEIVAAITRTPAGSVVVAGEPGSGRWSRSAAWPRAPPCRGRLARRPGLAGGARSRPDLRQPAGRPHPAAGRRLRQGRKVVLRMPGFESAVSAGRASGDPRSIADRLAGPVARGAPPIIAEMSADALEVLPRECAPLARLLAVRPIRPALRGPRR